MYTHLPHTCVFLTVIFDYICKYWYYIDIFDNKWLLLQLNWLHPHLMFYMSRNQPRSQRVLPWHHLKLAGLTKLGSGKFKSLRTMLGSPYPKVFMVQIIVDLLLNLCVLFYFLLEANTTKAQRKPLNSVMPQCCLKKRAVKSHWRSLRLM